MPFSSDAISEREWIDRVRRGVVLEGRVITIAFFLLAGLTFLSHWSAHLFAEAAALDRRADELIAELRPFLKDHRPADEAPFPGANEERKLKELRETNDRLEQLHDHARLWKGLVNAFLAGAFVQLAFWVRSLFLIASYPYASGSPRSSRARHFMRWGGVCTAIAIVIRWWLIAGRVEHAAALHACHLILAASALAARSGHETLLIEIAQWLEDDPLILSTYRTLRQMLTIPVLLFALSLLAALVGASPAIRAAIPWIVWGGVTYLVLQYTMLLRTFASQLSAKGSEAPC